MSMLNEEVAARLAGHLRNDTTDLAASDLHVPISHFVSQERAAAEREAIRKVPLIVARGSEIAEPGDQQRPRKQRHASMDVVEGVAAGHQLAQGRGVQRVATTSDAFATGIRFHARH